LSREEGDEDRVRAADPVVLSKGAVLTMSALGQKRPFQCVAAKVRLVPKQTSQALVLLNGIVLGRALISCTKGVDMERRLAAILAADVVGYSALVERDEAGTFERLQAGRKELFEPEIARHHGRIFKLMGDGLLAEFSSVVDAVECAVALRRGLAECNASLPDAQHLRQGSRGAWACLLQQWAG
jgi:class 3 adenylate cyclase